MSPSERLLVVAAVLRRGPGTSVLLTRRPEGKHLGGMWEFPGGKVEPGEHPEHALMRECREECGLTAQVEGILDVSWHPYPDREVLLLFYDCRLLGSQAVQHLGVSDHAWVRPEDLDAFPLPPADRGLVEKLQAGR